MQFQIKNHARNEYIKCSFRFDRYREAWVFADDMEVVHLYWSMDHSNGLKRLLSTILSSYHPSLIELNYLINKYNGECNEMRKDESLIIGNINISKETVNRILEHNKVDTLKL